MSAGQRRDSGVNFVRSTCEKVYELTNNEEFNEKQSEKLSNKSDKEKNKKRTYM